MEIVNDKGIIDNCDQLSIRQISAFISSTIVTLNANQSAGDQTNAD